MPYLITVPETRTDPEDTHLIVDRLEVEEAVIQIMQDEGIAPTTVYLIDDYTNEEMAIEVSDWLEFEELVALERIYIS